MASSASTEQCTLTGGNANSSAMAIAEELALPPVKVHCSVLAEDAIKAAIDDYQSKHTAQQNTDAEAVTA